MRALTALGVYTLVQLTEYLRRVKNYDPVIYEDGSYEKYGQRLIMSSMQELVSQLQMYELSKPEANALSALVRDFRTKYIQSKPGLEDVDCKRLVLLVERIEVALREEITRRNFAELTPVEGMLNYNKLLSEGLRSLLGDIAGKIPRIVSQDLDEAVKCLSYGAPTASVMIGLRAVEGMLKQVHSNLTGDESRKTWKQLLEGIEQDLKAKGIEESPIFGYLNYVRDVRNQADHPDRTFTLLEAEQLFMHAIHIIREVEKLGGTASNQ